MNYALDALWWKLTQQNVRDLASVLTAPPLWHTGCELPVASLLGDTGFRCLLVLDQNPQPLLNYLAQEGGHKFRLGFYAERLLAFWFCHAPHWQLLAHNVPLTENKQTIGAIDFLVQNKNTPQAEIYHIELTCKYYFSTETQAKNPTFIGLNPSDSLNKKTKKLAQQLNLTSHPAFQKLPESQWQPAQSVSIVRGNAFTPSGLISTEENTLNPHAWTGRTIEQQHMPKEWHTKRFYPVSSLNLLAPVKVTPQQTIDFDTLQQGQTPQIIAQVDKRYDGLYHEQERFIICAPTLFED